MNTELAAAYANLAAAQDDFAPIARALKIARNAFNKSMSAKRAHAALDASNAFDAALARCSAAHAAIETAEVLAAVAESQSFKAATDAAQPSFIF